MGEKLDMQGTSYSKIERGQINIPIKRLIQIAEILKVNITEFFEDKHANSVKENKNQYGFATKDEVENLSKLMQKLLNEFESFKKQKPVKKKKNPYKRPRKKS